MGVGKLNKLIKPIVKLVVISNAQSINPPAFIILDN